MHVRSLLGFALVLSPLLLLIPMTKSSYAEVRQGNKITISGEEVIEDDLYVFAQEVNVEGAIQGDLIVFGQRININGSVDGDFIAAAQQVFMSGQVADDARIACQVLTLQDGAEIGDDLIAASYQLECAQGSHIGGEVKFAGYQSVFAGHVEEIVKLASAHCELSGSFGNSVEATIDSGNFGAPGIEDSDSPAVLQGLIVSRSANIDGDLSYESNRKATIDPQSTITGDVRHSPIRSETDQPLTLADRASSFAQQFFALLLVGMVVVYIFPDWTGRVANNIQRRPLASLGWGVLTLVAVIAGVIVLLVATIAVAVLLGYVSLNNLLPAWLWLGALTTAVVIVGFWLFATWVAKVVVSVWAGNRVVNGPDWKSNRRGLALGFGALMLVALTWIPVVGGVLSVFVMLIGVGSAANCMLAKSEVFASGKPRV